MSSVKPELVALVKNLSELNRNQAEIINRFRRALFFVGVENKQNQIEAVPPENRDKTSLFWLLNVVNDSWTNALSHARSWHKAYESIAAALINERKAHSNTMRAKHSVEAELMRAKKRIAELELQSAAHALGVLSGPSM